MIKSEKDTILALSTPQGEGGISIVRISGPKALLVLNKIFRLPNNKKAKHQTHRLVYGFIHQNKKKLDEVLVSYMKSPKTYTGEDIAEINSHGGPVLVQKIMDLILSLKIKDIRLAKPGEFTKRAFLSGRIDLSQAEAVSDLIKAKSEKAIFSSINQLSGLFSQKINNLKKEMMELTVKVSANVDFFDEDIPEITKKELLTSLNKIKEEIEVLLQSAKFGRIFKEGINVCLVGLPNVGKSSILNAFLEEERAIVTEIAGTTRDTISETIQFSGLAIKLTDTCGIVKSKNKLEKIGVRKSITAISEADLVLIVAEANRKADIVKFFNNLEIKAKEILKEKPIILVINKSDLIKKVSTISIDKFSDYKIDKTPIFISALKNQGLKKLEKKIIKKVCGEEISSQNIYVTNLRHKKILEETKGMIGNAILATKDNLSFDLILIDLETTLDSLGEITGEKISEKVLDQIFASFCIGK